ncbi:uroporphyrinogen decarboxylase family protein [Bacillus sp. EB600]|uniref:uroporphyrinogen decarboxylase family protein n=1 Tax=Bacillus sp. EB600 TaxID=2806345 RepID=UPI00210F0B5A|nr:uroporphyrinogen decarboxylase family protein [Bacillus sp. EB600]MCQ6282406.1 hypothetical protein [Bacillus sp. EB600]
MNNKELVEKLFKGRAVSRPPFLPLLGTYVTKVDQVTVEQMYLDSSSLSSAITNTQQLLGYDALLTPVDPTLEAEALGASIVWNGHEMPSVSEHVSIESSLDIQNALSKGRLPVLIETLERLVTVKGKTYPIIAVINGPLTVLKQVYGDGIFRLDQTLLLSKIEEISQFLTQLCKRLGDVNVDGILVNEEIGPDEVKMEKIGRAFTPIFNVIKFYNLFGILRIPSELETEIDPVPDVLIGSQNYVLNNKVKTKGIALDETFWTDPLDQSAYSSIWSENKKRRLFLSTSKPLDVEISLERVQEKISLLCEEKMWA